MAHQDDHDEEKHIVSEESLEEMLDEDEDEDELHVTSFDDDEKAWE